jgi:hypothetical protein
LWLERLNDIAPVATVLGSIPVFLGTVGICGAADEAVLNIVLRKNLKKFPKILFEEKNL